MARRRTTLLFIEVAHFYLALRMAITSEFVSNLASSSYVLQIADVAIAVLPSQCYVYHRRACQIYDKYDGVHFALVIMMSIGARCSRYYFSRCLVAHIAYTSGMLSCFDRPDFVILILLGGR